MSEEPANPPWKSVVFRAWTRRCPRCGTGDLFAKRFRLAESCPTCDLVYRREQGGMTGQMYLTSAVTEIFAAGLVFAIFLGTDWGAAQSIAVGVPIVAVFSYWFLPRAMGLWVAIEYLTDRANGEEWTRG